MDWLDALILGIVQGLAEYLPISSSGHLEICREILGLKLAGAEALEFDAALHVATVLSTLVVLWREFVPLCTSFFTMRRDERTVYVWKILLSCVPVAIIGLAFKPVVESFFGSGLTIVGTCLIITAGLLAFASYRRRAGDVDTESKDPDDPEGYRSITWFTALAMGVAQAIAILPGLSRSGTTIATGLTLGGRPAQVAKFSFFMVVIPILGEAILSIKDMAEGTSAMATGVGIVPLAIGFVAAFLVGCAACRWMIDIVKRGKLQWFAVYCVVVGLICLIW